MNHPSDNPFYSNIDSMPDIRPRRKSIPLVSELVSIYVYDLGNIILLFYYIFNDSMIVSVFSEICRDNLYYALIQTKNIN